MESLCREHPNCKTIIITRICIVLISNILGVIGNGTVLYIYRQINRQHPQNNKKNRYIIIMAWLDLFFTAVIMPQVALFEFGLVYATFMTQSFIFVTMYLVLQIAIVFDRVFAVFTPFKYAQNRDKSNKVLCVICIIIIVYLESVFMIDNYLKLKLPKKLLENSIVCIYIVVFTIPLIAYPAIAFKLWRQKRKILCNTIANHQSVQASQTRAAHIKTLRLYVGVLCLFIASYVPNIIVGITGIHVLIYFFFVNNIGNPVVYYILNEEFQNEVKKLVVKIKQIV